MLYPTSCNGAYISEVCRIKLFNVGRAMIIRCSNTLKLFNIVQTQINYIIVPVRKHCMRKLKSCARIYILWRYVRSTWQQHGIKAPWWQNIHVYTAKLINYVREVISNLGCMVEDAKCPLFTNNLISRHIWRSR